MEYDGSVESGVVETDAVACASRLRSPSFMLALYCFGDFLRKKVFDRLDRRAPRHSNQERESFTPVFNTLQPDPKILFLDIRFFQLFLEN